MKSRLNIKTAFKNAFPTRPIPSQLFLDGLEIKNWDIPGELQNRLLSHEWTRVSIEDWASIGPIASIKSYVTPMAFRYYLPSILLGSIENLTYWDLGLEALLPNNFKRVPHGGWWKEFFRGFTYEQKKAVQAYLKYASKLAPAGGMAASWIPLALEIFRTDV